jgi:hypothetical protein
MTNLNLNMDDVQDVDFSPIPKGRYTGVVESIMYRVSDPAKGGSGQPYLNWTWLITGPQYAGRKVFQTTSLQSQSLWVLKANLKALDMPHTGIVPINFDEASGIILQPAAIGKPATLEISINGKYNSIDAVLSINEANVPTIVASPVGSPPALNFPQPVTPTPVIPHTATPGGLK